MGQLQSGPVANIATETHGNAACTIGVASMHGWREFNEDRHSVKMRLSGRHKHIAYAALFDGHGGTGAAQWFSQHLHLHIERLDNPHDTVALEQAVMDADAEFLKLNALDKSGCTMVLPLVSLIAQTSHSPASPDKTHRVTCAWTGDARAIVVDAGFDNVIHASVDHKAAGSDPEVDIERTRIELAEGCIDKDGYVYKQDAPGGKCIGMSRSLGDRDLKVNWWDEDPRSFIISACPGVFSVECTADQGVLMACDGLFEVGTNVGMVHQLEWYNTRWQEGVTRSRNIETCDKD
jgi:serine/threonine protein phosphatase PrpC